MEFVYIPIVHTHWQVATNEIHSYCWFTCLWHVAVALYMQAHHREGGDMEGAGGRKNFQFPTLWHLVDMHECYWTTRGFHYCAVQF